MPLNSPAPRNPAAQQPQPSPAAAQQPQPQPSQAKLDNAAKNATLRRPGSQPAMPSISEGPTPTPTPTTQAQSQDGLTRKPTLTRDAAEEHPAAQSFVSVRSPCVWLTRSGSSSSRARRSPTRKRRPSTSCVVHLQYVCAWCGWLICETRPSQLRPSPKSSQLANANDTARKTGSSVARGLARLVGRLAQIIDIGVHLPT